MRGLTIKRRALLSLAAGALLSGGPVGRAIAGRPAQLLRIGGTGSALGGMKMLAALFSKHYPDIAIVVLPSLGSSGGIRAMAARTIDLAISARPLSSQEAGAGLEQMPYARTPLVFATRFDNRVERIETPEIEDIYAGHRKSWANGDRIRLILRPERETEMRLLRAISARMGKAVDEALARSNAFVALNDQHNGQALETVPGSFGMITLAQARTERRKLQLMALDGVEGSVEMLARGGYPYAKELYLVCPPVQGTALSRFVDFIARPEAEAMLRQNGHLVGEFSPAGDG